MITVNVEDTIREKYRAIRPELDERGRRVWAGTEAKALGHGGIACLCRATGLSENTIRAGLRELASPRPAGDARRRVRAPGAGRPRLEAQDTGLIKALNDLVEPTTRGDPMSPLRWTCKSTRRLAQELASRGHPVGRSKVSSLLGELGYSLQGTRKTREGSSHPDRNGQFKYINRRVKEFQRRHDPVVSVDTKKKELVGDFANKGREYQKKGKPVEVRTHDFPDKKLGKAIPYGVYDLTDNSGWVSVGIDHDTSQFAVETIRRWWFRMGIKVYPDARQLLITADC